jgi:hypothetical protein
LVSALMDRWGSFSPGAFPRELYAPSGLVVAAFSAHAATSVPWGMEGKHELLYDVPGHNYLFL